MPKSSLNNKNSDGYVNHSLGLPLSELDVKLFISTDGTDANSFEALLFEQDSTVTLGQTAFYVDDNNIKVHCHHIIPYIETKNNSDNNLITLCESCHAKLDAMYNNKYKRDDYFILIDKWRDEMRGKEW